MLRQEPRNSRYGGARAFHIMPRPVVRFDLAADRFPLGRGDALIDTAVGNDLNRTIGAQHVDEHAIVGLRIQMPSRANISSARARGLTWCHSDAHGNAVSMANRISPACCASAAVIAASISASTAGAKQDRVARELEVKCRSMRPICMSPASRGAAAAEATTTAAEAAA